MKKRLSLILSTLTAVSLLTVGFSTWIIRNINSEKISANVSAGELIQNNLNLIQLVSRSNFVICKDGVVEDQTIINQGELGFNLKLDVNKATTNDFVKDNKINYKVSLISNTLSNIFDNTFFVGGNIIVGGNSTSLSGQVLNLGTPEKPLNAYVANVSLNINPGNTFEEFSFKYTFQGDIYSQTKEGARNLNFDLKLENI